MTRFPQPPGQGRCDGREQVNDNAGRYYTCPGDAGRVRFDPHATRNSTGGLREGFEEDYSPEERPGAVHPMIRAHPETGRKALFLGRRRNAHVMGLPAAESDRLLDELWAFCTQPRFVWVQGWRRGDAVLWDNRCVLHRRDSFDPGLRRLMHRTQIKGTRPY